MPKKPLIRTSDYFYHVYNRSNQKLWFNCSLDDVWKISKKALHSAYNKHPVEVAQYVLMHNHYHLLIRTPDANIDQFMYEFGKNFSLQLRLQTNLVNRMFGGRYKWSLIQSQDYLFNVYRYIYQNPIRSNASTTCENYPFSTLNTTIYKRPFPIPVVKPFDQHKDLLQWLNIRESNKKILEIRKGLKKSIFKPTIERRY